MAWSIKQVLSACKAVAKQPRLFAGQRGFSILPLALAGLLGTSAVAVPLLNRAVSAVSSTERSSPVSSAGAEAAAWYAMWRLEHDPTVHTEFTGSPPTATFEFRGAQVTIIGVEPPDNHGIIMSFTSSPNEALPNTPATVTYTLKVKNDRVEDHELIRVDVNAAGSFRPTHVSGSTYYRYIDPPSDWIPVQDPSQGGGGGKFNFHLQPAITLGGLGQEIEMTWQMTVDENEGNYWMEGLVKPSGYQTIDGLTEANVLVAAPNDILITTTVELPDPERPFVEAGVSNTYTYDVVIANNGPETYTIKEIIHWTPEPFNYDGPTTGLLSTVPQRHTDSKGNGRDEWQWKNLNIELPPYSQLNLSFIMSATLKPGTWFSETAIITEESLANGQEVASTTSATAPIKAVRVYDIHVDHGDVNLDIEALLDYTGVDPLSWEQS